jgi:transcriptional regulator MraZ
VGFCGTRGNTGVFSGRFDHAIDEKGRVSIPSRFREVLARDGHDRLYITNFVSNRERCLELYPPSEWMRLVGKLKQKTSFDPAVQLFQTFYIGGAHEVQVDKQGRILIPPKLREFAALARDVTFSAMTDHFQLWDKPTLEKILKTIEKNFHDPKFLERLNL